MHQGNLKGKEERELLQRELRSRGKKKAAAAANGKGEL